MLHRYLFLFALILAAGQSGRAQQLSPAVLGRPHNWYVAARAAISPIQQFTATNGVLQNVAGSVQPAWGVRLGYSHSPSLALETGLSYLKSSNGFWVQAPQTGRVPYVRNSVHIPLTAVIRLRELTPRLMVRALLGAGVLLRAPAGYFSTFSDTVGYLTGSRRTKNERVFVSKQGASPDTRYNTELGLRAEWQLLPSMFIGGEVSDMIAVAGKENATVSIIDEATNSMLATATITSRQHTLSAGIHLRYVFQMGTSYQYHPL